MSSEFPGDLGNFLDFMLVRLPLLRTVETDPTFASPLDTVAVRAEHLVLPTPNLLAHSTPISALALHPPILGPSAIDVVHLKSTNI